ncbi:hypothetical protein NDU88_008432 [Pleurodeles waltl]|uniref:Secreted protein n=1 Tax=Pleurodeles waltl TaxID=8319 RepID=A0AAV7RXZ3_PLEWA|nr:hypothetical protein NDU88_008432 [Pleurodeles waltl]
MGQHLASRGLMPALLLGARLVRHRSSEVACEEHSCSFTPLEQEETKKSSELREAKEFCGAVRMSADGAVFCCVLPWSWHSLVALGSRIGTLVARALDYSQTKGGQVSDSSQAERALCRHCALLVAPGGTAA